MKIVFTSDNHIFYGNQIKSVKDMMEKIRAEKPDVVANLGDLGEVLIAKDFSLVEELFSIKPTVWVAGNHDLYSYVKYDPPEAMEEFLKVMQYGIPLQKSWKDKCTYYEKDGVLFLGTIGFPDFSHPKLMMPTKYYDDKSCTIDSTYINLEGGWLQYSNPLMEAFNKKLQLINESKCKNIIILTHYNIFESQYNFDPNNDISVYFYCHKIGLMVKEIAMKNTDKNFYAISAHGHNFNRGEWVKETPNLTTHGINTDYNSQKFITLDI